MQRGGKRSGTRFRDGVIGSDDCRGELSVFSVDPNVNVVVTFRRMFTTSEMTAKRREIIDSRYEERGGITGSLLAKVAWLWDKCVCAPLTRLKAAFVFCADLISPEAIHCDLSYAYTCPGEGPCEFTNDESIDPGDHVKGQKHVVTWAAVERGANGPGVHYTVNRAWDAAIEDRLKPSSPGEDGRDPPQFSYSCRATDFQINLLHTICMSQLNCGYNNGLVRATLYCCGRWYIRRGVWTRGPFVNRVSRPLNGPGYHRKIVVKAFLIVEQGDSESQIRTKIMRALNEHPVDLAREFVRTTLEVRRMVPSGERDLIKDAATGVWYKRRGQNDDVSKGFGLCTMWMQSSLDLTWLNGSIGVSVGSTAQSCGQLRAYRTPTNKDIKYEYTCAQFVMFALGSSFLMDLPNGFNTELALPSRPKGEAEREMPNMDETRKLMELMDPENTEFHGALNVIRSNLNPIWIRSPCMPINR